MAEQTLAAGKGKGKDGDRVAPYPLFASKEDKSEQQTAFHLRRMQRIEEGKRINEDILRLQQGVWADICESKTKPEDLERDRTQ